MSGKGSRRRSRPGSKFADNYAKIETARNDPYVEADPITSVLDACAEQNAKEPKMETYYICADCLTDVIQVVAGDESLDYCGECERLVEGNTLQCIRELDE